MFVRADRLLAEMTELGVHIIWYRWIGFNPSLTVFDRERRRLEESHLEAVDLLLSKKKTCVGRFDTDGYLPCPDRTEVRGFSQCRKCASDWIPIQECIFEPKCRGERCDCKFCSREHIVYMAFIGRTIKVGMTGGGRLEERGIEQGADAIVPISVCDSRLDARIMENRLARKLGLTQRVPLKEALKAISAPAEREFVKAKHRSYMDRNPSLFSTTEDEVVFLDQYPLGRLDEVPLLTSTGGWHQGDLLGFKGKFAVYRGRDGKLRAINLSDSVARSIIPSDSPLRQ
jgi:hypothetical protein